MKLYFPTGIEIESGGGSSLTKDHMPPEYKLGADGTAGHEARSIKFMDGDQVVDATKTVCAIMKRHHCSVHDVCGLHVHIGFKQVGDLSAKYRIFRFASCYEKLIFQLLPPHPQRSTYCLQLHPDAWSSFRSGEGFDFWKNAKITSALALAIANGTVAVNPQNDDGTSIDLEESVNMPEPVVPPVVVTAGTTPTAAPTVPPVAVPPPTPAATDLRNSRYWWFNGQAMFKYGTIEFRLMNGTLDADDILGWVGVLQCMFHSTVNLGTKLAWHDRSVNVDTFIRDLRVEDNDWGQRATAFILKKAAQAHIVAQSNQMALTNSTL